MPDVVRRDPSPPPGHHHVPGTDLEVVFHRRSDNDLILRIDKRGVQVFRARLPHRKYYEPGSKEDQYARRALAELLRAGLPLDARIRHAFANLLDPLTFHKCHPEDYTLTCERSIVFEHIDGRRKTDALGN